MSENRQILCTDCHRSPSPSWTWAKNAGDRERTIKHPDCFIYYVYRLLTLPLCFILVGSLYDFACIKYSKHLGIEGLLKICVACINCVLLITEYLWFFNSCLIIFDAISNSVEWRMMPFWLGERRLPKCHSVDWARCMSVVFYPFSEMSMFSSKATKLQSYWC